MNNKLKIVFAGTPEFAVPTLNFLDKSSHEVVCVMTQPDRRSGRGMKINPSPIKKAAQDRGLYIMQPESLDTNIMENIKDLNADILIVAAYGLIIPNSILNLFTKGCFNVHASLLPRWRGAAPIHRAIESGDTHIGVTIMKVVERLDAGPMAKKASIKLLEKYTTGDMAQHMAIMGAELMLDTVETIALCKPIEWVVQNEDEVTYAKKITKAEGKLNLNDEPNALIRKIKAFNPYPGIHGLFREKGLKIWDAQLINDIKLVKDLKPGDLKVEEKRVILCLSLGGLELTEVQPEGTKKMKAADFITNYKINEGDRIS